MKNGNNFDVSCVAARRSSAFAGQSIERGLERKTMVPLVPSCRSFRASRARAEEGAIGRAASAPPRVRRCMSRSAAPS